MPLYPGAKIGIIGGGQLGRMTILEARRMGYRSIVLDADPSGPAGQVADRVFHPDDAADFAKYCDVVTYEFEHLDIDLVSRVEAMVDLSPSAFVLRVKQNRISEKSYLRENGFPVPEFRIFSKAAQLEPLIGKTPLMVKISQGGYDGKGLFVIKTRSEYEDCKNGLDAEMIAEDLVPFVKEISVICARDKNGKKIFYPVAENIHDAGILLYSIAPADIDEKAKSRAYEIAGGLADKFKLIGLLVVEMFLLENNEILINEFAPRPHNSGHYTMDACDISQFEMLLRAVCNLPLTEPELLCPAAMLNVLGKGAGELKLAEILSFPGAKLHLYGKSEVRERRKMGHINILGKTPAEAAEKLKAIKSIVYEKA